MFINFQQLIKREVKQMLLSQPQTAQIAPDSTRYIANKVGMSVEDVEKKILSCEIFTEMKGEGLDLDTHIMEEILKENDFYQKPHQKLMKDDALRFVKNIVEEWSIQIARNEIKISKDELPNYVAKALPFGSYVLDLRSNSSDIDLVCVCPSFISMDKHFFGGLVQKLLRCTDVTGLSSRIGAKVPIITFDYKEINIDVSFCQLGGETVPRDIQKVITPELILSITDEKSKTALLGRKNNLMILESTKGQMENFKQTLRVIKVWAKNRAISSNGMGYLGGISWAILLAKICQIFPNHKPNRLFYEFFRVYSNWNWKELPVKIIPADYKDEMAKKQFYMFVATPGVMYNSTERVNRITFKALIEQIRRASQLLMANRQIKQVCKPTDFLDRYPLFVEIVICGQNKSKQEERDYKDFSGNVESKVLILLINIIKYNRKQLDQGILTVVPNPKPFKKTYVKKQKEKDKRIQYPLCNSFLIGVDTNDRPVNLLPSIQDWCVLIDKYARQGKVHLNVCVFKTTKIQLMKTIEFSEVKKKEEKRDPRLENRLNKKALDPFKQPSV